MAEVSFPWAPRGDVIAFETPELTRVEYRLAPFGARVVAAALDRLIIVAICVLLGIGAVFAASGAGLLGDSQGPMILLAGAVTVIVFLPTLLLAWLEARSGGQTWGKRLMGLRTVSLTGHAPGAAASLVRNLARLVDDLPLLWIVPTLTASRQRLGDLLAGTCVVVERTARERVAPVKWPAESWRALEDRQFELPPEAARRLVAADLDLIEHVMRRVEPEQSPRRREALLRPIVVRYIRRLEVPQLEAEALKAPRRFLGELGLMLKDRQEAPERPSSESPRATEPRSTTIALRERDLGQLLAHILEVATEQFGRLFLLQLVVGLPLLVTQLVLRPGEGLANMRLDTPPEELLPIVAAFYGEIGLLGLITALTYPIEQATVALLVKRLVNGEPPDLGACLLGALRLWPRCLLLTVTLGVITTLGSLCCIAPGVIFWTWFFVAMPVLVIEGGSWTSAFGRSRALVGGIDPNRGGRFWEALAVYLLSAFAPAMVLTPFVMGLSLVPSPAAQAIIGHFAMITFGVLPLTAPSVLYYHLRVVREAHDVDRLADLVDAIGAITPKPTAPKD